MLQPYKTKAGFIVKTVLQNVCIASNVESLPVNTAKQKSAFPPNFVHSLDATHMFITSLKMKESGLYFAAVHDSYWTHPCHVDIMREVCIQFHSFSYFSASDNGWLVASSNQFC